LRYQEPQPKETQVAKPLIFRFGDEEIAFTLLKIDRTKLYGFKEIEVLDERNQPCELATLADDGRTVIGRGGTGIGYISADGLWCEKSDLTPVDLDGNEIEPVPSSFSAPVPLTERASYEDYLEHNIRAVYQLQAENDGSDLLEALKIGAIFKFPYSFRGGLEADVGFLLTAADGNTFLAVGNPTKVEFVGLQQTAPIVEEEGAEEDEADLMDFDMI
jgi:hypothetical protein